MSVRRVFLISSLLLTLLITGAGLLDAGAFWAFLLVGPLIGMGLYDMVQTRHTLRRVYPIVGRGRYLMEDLRPKIYQYFIESDTGGRPIDRTTRSLVYQRAKAVNATTPFGTQLDVYANGYEWSPHSLEARPHDSYPDHPRIPVGDEQCDQPYDLSLLNISAMSYGALSHKAVMALNKGANEGGFAHNTGEGGISPYHLTHGGDLIWQIGTGYFGCRTPEGRFDPDKFEQNARRPTVKMIELKLSQGAKPGKGGVLPASKVSPEIAQIRGVPMGEDVISPPGHSCFSGPKGLLEFLAQLRERSGGKPVGIKLCIGRRSEFLGLCMAMCETGLRPDFITIDGAEGGTGAAPLEFSNSVGSPLREGLSFAEDALVGYGLRPHIRLLAAGKVFTAMDLMTAKALGADACYTARGFMLALGCIQALTCDTNHCPVGITTTDPERTVGLVVKDKAHRVFCYHRNTLNAFRDLLAATGLESHDKLRRWHIYRRASEQEVIQLHQRYPYIAENSLLSEPYPSGWDELVMAASPESFLGPVRGRD